MISGTFHYYLSQESEAAILGLRVKTNLEVLRLRFNLDLYRLGCVVCVYCGFKRVQPTELNLSQRFPQWMT